ncbi:hypothetical protein Gotur_023862 [Gossypium turneri]
MSSVLLPIFRPRVNHPYTFSLITRSNLYLILQLLHRFKI